MNQPFLTYLNDQIEELKSTGLYKQEREITSPQSSSIQISDGREVLNFCANNYLGLANHPKVIQAAINSYEHYGFGLASVRFICGTQIIHHQLEKRISHFLETEDTILYPSCFDANGGLFETLFSAEDAIISDELNHASIIDGIRLSKAQRFRYKNNDMGDLETKLKEAGNCRFKVIATDGVFSMDGIIANLNKITELADRYQALVMVDDCHAVGFLGKNGKGSIEYCDVLGKVDIITGTLGKALGGATGGYTAGRKEIIAWLRQRSRPYLFSNTVAPSIVAASLEVLNLIESDHSLKDKLHENARYFRKNMTALGFDLVPGDHPIIPLMLGDAKLAQEFAAKMLDHGIYVIGFCYPVVPKGKARIRTQMSAAHSKEDLDRAIEAFKTVGKALQVI
ncbi:MAG: glycine C-acetyltransferase [Parachlamydiaceae bacterium]